MDPYEVEDEPRMVSRNPMLVPCFLAVDYICMAGVVVLWFVLLFTDNLPGAANRGFWCHDRSLRMPYLEDELFTEQVLYIICFATPFIMIMYGECMLALCSCKKITDEMMTGRRKIVKSCSLKLYPVVRRILRFSGVFASGAFATWIITDAAQRVTGLQTPYFLTVCRPNLTIIDCTRFVPNAVCTTKDTLLIEQARRSFPSLHASLGSFTAVFTTAYLTSQVQIPCTRLPIPLTCLALLAGSFLWGVTRAARYRHHWRDVWVGFMLGTMVALYLVFAVLSCFEERPQQDPAAAVRKEPSPKPSPLSGYRLPRLRACNGGHLAQNGQASYHNPSFIGDSFHRTR
ncbi:phospholipid phosphatase-related protein type 1-like [Diadema antillarum]|uniref:phospholipid phosphatase-related protein type 1-like n=2 Tax=Diadema antillarum TaxID=105358 RepID=UPI003A8458AF